MEKTDYSDRKNQSANFSKLQRYIRIVLLFNERCNIFIVSQIFDVHDRHLKTNV